MDEKFYDVESKQCPWSYAWQLVSDAWSESYKICKRLKEYPDCQRELIIQTRLKEILTACSSEIEAEIEVYRELEAKALLDFDNSPLDCDFKPETEVV